ncbi:virulence factor [Lottiidibacillus patelloidae]|uniref:Virulence factor n=1 Tax=Lottiidibacillus patelloidae TaxID=2670334 RepID=A0A263BW65_9BACI|nr:virulence factor [Lottiidibacillus patelloidae]OZM57426.1 virulence factor [Lottiidibacillus patelloidae]
MRIMTIEPTPSPNTMKIVLNETLPSGETRNYKKEQMNELPTYAKQLLSIEGVKSFYHVADFIALERNPKFDWKEILPQVRQAFGEEVKLQQGTKELNDHFGEVEVYVQMFRNIPMQIKLISGEEELRVGLPDVFKNAAMKAQETSENIVIERKWQESGVRYGDLKEIGNQVSEEIIAAYPEERIERLVKQALEGTSSTNTVNSTSSKELEEALQSDDWKVRYAALDRYNPKIEDLSLLEKALQDEKVSIRRLAVVYIGMLEENQDKILPLLFEAMKDKAITIRRTAGDCLSDLGNTKAIPTMIAALKDKNKLVRWRAAMFLYEVGDESAIQALKEAENDSEFEVSMQVKMALARIEGGEEAKGSVWKQMTETMKESK